VLVGMVIFLTGEGAPLHHKRYERTGEEVEGELLSGFIYAIMSALRGELGGVREIRAENRTLHIEERRGVIAAVSTLRPADRKDVSALLSELLDAFLERYGEILREWDGSLLHFADADQIIDPIVQKYEDKFSAEHPRCAMILTTGKTAEPLIRTIRQYRPKHVCFVSSKEAIPQLSRVLQETHGDEQYQYSFHQVTDINSISHCVEVSTKAFSELLGRGYQPQEIVADITGGTKVMSAALTIAALRHQSPIIYVGGQHRDQHGRVIGEGEIIPAYNPREFHAHTLMERGIHLFNTNRFRTALEHFEQARQNLPQGPEKELATILRDLAKAYGLWDSFHHTIAHSILQNTQTRIQNLANLTPTTPLKELLKHVETNTQALKQITQTTPQTLPHTIADLLNNAQRRENEAKLDDAATRLKRALQLQQTAKQTQQTTQALNTLNEATKNTILAQGTQPIHPQTYQKIKQTTQKTLQKHVQNLNQKTKQLQFPKLNPNHQTYLQPNTKTHPKNRNRK